MSNARNQTQNDRTRKMASRTPNELWLESPHQQTVLCCDNTRLLAENMPDVADVDDLKIKAFMVAMRNESLNLTCNPTTIDLANAEYIVEVERTVKVERTMTEGCLSHARYFLPTSGGKYVEVHAKDAFRGINPIEYQNLRFAYHSEGCITPTHNPPIGFFSKQVGVVKNPLRGQNLLRPMRCVSGKWLIMGETANWGT